MHEFLKYIFGIKLTYFGQFLCPSSGVFHCAHSNGVCYTGLLTACELDQDGTSSVLILLASSQGGSGRNQFRLEPARKLSANLYDIYHCCVHSEKLLMLDRGTIRNL